MFVCLGNICRSPLAHGIFQQLVDEAGLSARFEIASSGTGAWHVGEPPDRRMRQTAQRYGVQLDDLRARRFEVPDFDAYDHIYVMDRRNLQDVRRLDQAGRYGAKVQLFRDFDPEPEDGQVPDPYYGGEKGFETVYSIVERTCQRLLDHLVEEHDLASGSEV
ncbi:MAG: low molecular weight protein-tyrosine-phosphatase [Rhodothermales bacterium]|nr:low molecular weight protein-tyrosine-phosphatase [Rhodothermales bacterium]